MTYLLLLLWWAGPALAEDFICAGSQGAPTAGAAAKMTRIAASTTGARRALVLFARFKGEPAHPVPSWAGDLFAPNLPGSVSHFYDTMSLGKLQLRGEVASRVYESAQPAVAYLADDPTQVGRFGQFSREILLQADQEIDFSRFDDDGDGVVDAVFIVLDKVPANFLQGPATGYGGLGFQGPFIVDEGPAVGQVLRIATTQGTVQQGRTFAEAAGSICHEYGHVLGLPDLYNTAFLQEHSPDPAEDDAGVGRWCLMGWGASGWHGDDGPNSFCAWSRLHLGWAAPEEIVEASQELQLGEVSQRGAICRLRWAGGQEYFLLEYRRRTGYYDRNIPGEGLLIWHVDDQFSQVDLECADGRWQDAGYPLGRQPDSDTGGDNLDFWAHDAGYAQLHAGNLGDITDPFDGVQYRAFTRQTNPSSRGKGIEGDTRIEEISLAGASARARISLEPLFAAEQVRLEDGDGDGLLEAGESAQLLFGLSSPGPLGAVKLRVRVAPADVPVEVLRAEAVFRGVYYDEENNRSHYAMEAGQRLTLLGGRSISQATQLELQLEIYDEVYGGLLWRQGLGTETLSQRLQEARLALIDTLGNRDGLAQPGEFIRLRLVVDHPELLRGVDLDLRNLDAQARLVSGPRIDGEGLAPEFLVSESATGRLGFELEAHSGGETRRDTLFAEVGKGRDQTAPRVLFFQIRVQGDSLLISLPAELVLEAGQTREASALVYREGVQVGMVPLLPVPGRGYAGGWAGAEPGRYLVEGVVTDQVGNRGRSPQQVVEVDDPARASSSPLLATARGVMVLDLAAAPDGSLVAAVDSNLIHLYRSLSLQELEFLPGRQLRALAFSAQGRFVATGGQDGLVRLWELASRQEAGFWGRHPARVDAVAFSPDGRWLASGGADGVVQVWELQTYRPVAVLSRPEASGVLSLEFAPGGKLLAAGDVDGRISLWEVAQGGLAGALVGHVGWVDAVVFSPDGRWLASGGRDHTVRLWDLAAPQEQGAVLYQGDFPMRAVAFSPDSQVLAGGGEDGIVHLWQVEEGREFGRLETGSSAKGLAFSPFGDRLVTGSIGGETRLWQMRRDGTGDLVALPRDTALLPAYPNPFNAGVILPYQLVRQAQVKLAVYNLAGQVARVLVDRAQAAGSYQVSWDGRDARGRELASGVYCCRLQAGAQIEARKLLLLR